MSEDIKDNKRKAEFLEDFYEMLSKEIVIAYRGTFEKSVLGVLAQNIESTIDSSSVLRRKFFKLFLELAQNISDHSVEFVKTSSGENSGSGMLIIKNAGDHYLFITGNLVENKDVEAFLALITHINSLKREDLREYKREQIELVEEGKNNCLGLIQIALVSRHGLGIKTIETENNQTFVIISASISNEN